MASRHRRDERGASSLLVVLFTVALFVVAGVVIDGGYALGAKRQAMNHAEQAARAGADALSEASLRDNRVRVNPTAARAAAQDYLRQVGTQGQVSVHGAEVTVRVATSHETTLLTLVGLRQLPVGASATAVSISENEP